MKRLFDGIVNAVSLVLALMMGAGMLISTFIVWLIGVGTIALVVGVTLVIIMLPFMLF